MSKVLKLLGITLRPVIIIPVSCAVSRAVSCGRVSRAVSRVDSPDSPDSCGGLVVVRSRAVSSGLELERSRVVSNHPTGIRMSV